MTVSPVDGSVNAYTIDPMLSQTSVNTFEDVYHIELRSKVFSLITEVDDDIFYIEASSDEELFHQFQLSLHFQRGSSSSDQKERVPASLINLKDVNVSTLNALHKGIMADFVKKTQIQKMKYLVNKNRKSIFQRRLLMEYIFNSTEFKMPDKQESDLMLRKMCVDSLCCQRPLLSLIRQLLLRNFFDDDYNNNPSIFFNSVIRLAPIYKAANEG